jgi:tetratricopeptide (TPR) repeat protein
MWLWAMPTTVSTPVRRDLSMGRADAALQRLDTVLTQDPSDPEGHNLRCRVYYQEEQWDQAIADCEAAVRLEPSNSNFHLWLGRAYGQKAARVSLVSAYKLARRVAAEFQQAVQLDPRNADALADLGEFDVSAPSIVGGGLSRAQAVEQQLQGVNQADALTLAARIAMAKKNYAGAEVDFKAAIAKASDPADAWMDLAAFYQQRGRLADMVAAAQSGAFLDRRHGVALVDGATTLLKAGQEPQTAIRWLEEYLTSQAQSEEAPAFAVHAQLAKMFQNQGNPQAAQVEISAAHALASGYRISPSDSSARASR